MTDIKFDDLGFALKSGFLKTHNVDADGVYLGVSETTYVTKGFGLPACAYLDEPMVEAKNNEVIIRQDNFWAVVPDFRGDVFYKKESGDEVTINEVGSISHELTDKKQPDSFYKWDAKKNNWILDKELKQAFSTAQNEAKKGALQVDVEGRIILLERKVKLNRATNEDIAMLDLLYGFTLDLDELDITKENLVFPELPI